MLVRGLYLRQIRSLHDAGYGCDQAAVLTSEAFYADPARESNALWAALGLPWVKYNTTADERGHRVLTNSRSKAQEGSNLTKTKLRPQTLQQLCSFYRREVLQLAYTYPHLELPRWWGGSDCAFHYFGHAPFSMVS